MSQKPGAVFGTFVCAKH